MVEIILWQTKQLQQFKTYLIWKVFKCPCYVVLQWLSVENLNLCWMEGWPTCLNFRTSTTLLFSTTVMSRFIPSLKMQTVRFPHRSCQKSITTNAHLSWWIFTFLIWLGFEIHLVLCSTAIFTCGADGKWKSSHGSAVTPTCIPGTCCQNKILWCNRNIKSVFVLNFIVFVYICITSSLWQANTTPPRVWEDHWRQQCSRRYHPLASANQRKVRKRRRHGDRRPLDYDRSSCRRWDPFIKQHCTG